MDNREQLRKSRKIVVKVGTNILFEAADLSRNRLKVLARQLAALKKSGREVVVVSSGAIGSGFKKLGLPEKPRALRLKQACAAVGQVGLMSAWEKAFQAEKIVVAQILLSADDLADRARFLNAKNTLMTLLEYGIVPVINENDTVALDELKFGDNDTLGALVAGLVNADLFINLTDIDGFYSADPRRDSNAVLLSEVDKITNQILNLAGGGEAGDLGTGGMYTKVRAAKRLSDLGIASVIARGDDREVLTKIVDGRSVGTFFKPSARHLASKKSWMAFASRPKGLLTVDAGAARALTERGKSLLPGGIIKVSGGFSAGDVVKIQDETEETLALGQVNYNSAEVEKIKGRRSRDITSILGFYHSEEVIHRDNMVMAKGLV